MGHDDQFSLKTLEFRLQATGALPSGPITLVNMLPGHLQSKVKAAADDDDDDRAFRDKGSARRGKVGIRNGLAGNMSDD